MKTLITTLALLSFAATGGTAQAYYPHNLWHSPSGWHSPRPIVYSPWHGGYWHHGWHEGRAGWWWVSAGLWNFYSAPVYPYPPQPYVVEVPMSVPPAPLVIPAPVPSAVMPVPPPPPAPTAVIPHLPTSGDNTLFYCASSNAYFPYVPSCADGWELKQGTPAH